MSKPEVVFVLGGPGVGKGTQCAKLSSEYNFIHLSAGELLRAERNSGGENATLINNYIKNGEIVPVEITVKLIKTAMLKNGWDKKRYLIDGFPRN
jgi:UMP-CMP kinase